MRCCTTKLRFLGGTDGDDDGGGGGGDRDDGNADVLVWRGGRTQPWNVNNCSLRWQKLK